VFRQRVNIVSLGDDSPSRTLALDPGVNVIAGIRTNRMSGKGCEHVMADTARYSTDENPNGYAPTGDLCDIETLMVAASAMNPGDILVGCTGGHPANACFKPGGGVVEYITHPNFTDGGIAYGGATCTGDPTDIVGNEGCAQPIAEFIYTDPNSDGDPEEEVKVDPRMLMIIHEAFGQ